MNQEEVVDVGIEIKERVEIQVLKRALSIFFPMSFFEEDIKYKFFEGKSNGYLETRYLGVGSIWNTHIYGEIASSFFTEKNGASIGISLLNICLSLNKSLNSDILIENEYSDVGEWILIRDGQLFECFEDGNEEHFDIILA